MRPPFLYVCTVNKTPPFAQNSFMKKCVIILLVAASLTAVLTSCTTRDDLCENEISQYVRLSESVKFMIAGEETDLHAVFTPRGTSFEVEWSSDNIAVASVEEGRVTANSSGRAQIAVKIVNTKHEAVCEVIVSDKEVSEKYAGREGGGRFSTLDGALENCADGDSILLFRGFHESSVPVSRNIKLLGEQGAVIGGLEVTDGAVVNLENITFYTSDKAHSGSLTVDGGCGALIKNCRFVYDVKDELPGSDAYEQGKADSSQGQGEEQTPRGAKGTTALEMRDGFTKLRINACAFSGYEVAIDILPSDGEILVRDNTFTSCATAIRVDVRGEDTKNTALYGIIQSNVFSAVDHPTIFNYNGGLYMGTLKFDDYKSN